MSKYKGWSDRQVLDHREKQLEYLSHRLRIAETAMAGAWSLTILPGTDDIAYCLKSYREAYPDAIGLWTGDTTIPKVTDPMERALRHTLECLEQNDQDPDVVAINIVRKALGLEPMKETI